MRPEQIVEATLFASQTPLTASEIARADDSLDPGTVVDAIRHLRERYEQDERAFQVYQLGEGFQLLTRPEYAPYLERFDSVPRSPTLSSAAVETLAIVAYRQPISRVEIEDVRGVGAVSVLRTLLDWELVEVVGRGEGLGRPLLYGTTGKFLEHFGLKSLDELPGPEALPVTLRELARAGDDEAHDGVDAGEPVSGAETDGAGNGPQPGHAGDQERAARGVEEGEPRAGG